MANNFKKALATVLSGAVVLSTFSAAGCVFVNAENGKNDVNITENPVETGTSADGQYDASHVATQLLVTHTGKSSELPVRDEMETFETAQEDFDNNFVDLSCDEELYSGLGFDTDKLKANAKEYATNKNYQNPLSGFTFVNPNELFIGSVGHSGKNKALLQTCNDVSNGDASKLGDADDLDKAVKNYTEEYDSEVQTHNGIGIDIDGDGLDELAYFSLYYENSNCYAGIDIFDRQKDDKDKICWSKNTSFSVMIGEDESYVKDILAAESKGFTPLAVGDYDGDGLEELACYMPAKDGDKSSDARIQIYKFQKNGNSYSHTLEAEIKLSSINNDYGEMGLADGDGIYLPVVSLSTSSIRLSGKRDSSVGATQYNTHDDLVVSVSVPREYCGKNLNLNSTTAIYSLEDIQNNQPTLLFRYEYKTFDENTKRMGYINSCDADLNGDGFKELVVAGLKEQELEKPKNINDPSRSYGEFDNSHNYVNIITHDGDNYRMVWSDPREVKAPGNLSPKHYNAIEPTAMCAGHFMYTVPGTEGEAMPGLKEQICIQGVVLDCQDCKISGAPAYIENQGKDNEVDYIVDTKPQYDTKNFADAGFVDAYIYDISLEETVDATGDIWIDQCISGRFFNESDVDQIAIVSSDPVDANDDNIYMDISIISQFRNDSTEEPVWTYKPYNDYLQKQNEDDNGTSLFITFVDVEEDTYYYRYAGTYSTYSAPILYSIIQAPPHYEESNEIFSSDMTITTGLTNHSGIDFGVGVNGGAESTVKGKFFGSEVSMGLGFSAALDFAYNHTWSWDKTVAKTISLNSKDDYAICYTTPFIINIYEVVRTKDLNEEPEYVEFCEPQTPVFTALTVDEYNNAIDTSEETFNKKEDTENEIPPDQGTPKITPDLLPASAPGDPTLYVGESSDITEESGTDAGTVMVNIVNSPNVTTQGAGLSFTTSNDNTGSVTLSASACIKFGFKANAFIFEGESNVTFGASAHLGGIFGRTNSDGVEFGTTYYMPTRTLPNNAVFESDTEGYNSTIVKSSQIKHYIPEDGSMYNYDAESVCYKIEDLKVNRDMAKELGGDVDMNADDKVFALSFATSNYSYPPEPPKEFSIQSMVKNPDGSADITLLWNSENRNPKRKTTAYNIYISDTNSNSKTIHLQNKDNIIAPSGSRYTTYTVHLNKGDYNDKSVFYIAPAYATTKTDSTLIVTEGIISETVSIESLQENTNGNLIITKQPEIYYMSDNDSDETAEFSIDVMKNIVSDSPVKFFWQVYNDSKGEWETMFTDTLLSPTSVSGSKEYFHSEYSFDIPGTEKASYVDKGVRCISNISNYSVESDIVTLRFGENEPEEPVDPEKNKFTISNYDELVLFRDKYNSEYETYKNAEVELSANVVAPGSSVWDKGIGTSEKPFIGTFDGKGFGIAGLNVSIDKNGGLFENIGTSGIVKDLAVIDCEFSKKSEYAGGIAAINNGTIDHCLSGVNTDPSFVIYDKNGKKLYPYEYNSYIYGSYSGGIAGMNNGTITGTRNASTVNGANCGGIAGINYGTIYGCANNGSAGKDSVSVLTCGGIAAQNSGSIGSSYNSGKPTGSSSKNSSCILGMIAAVNNSTDITNTFCSKINSIPKLGSGTISDPTIDITVLGNTMMLDASFADTLNSVTDDSVTWAQKNINGTYLNCSYPVILGNFLKTRTITLSNGITLNGLMHSNLNISYSETGSDSEIYSAFSAALPGRGLTVYSVSCDDGSGAFVPADFWCSGVSISVPVAGDNVYFAIMGSDGTVRMIEPDSIENGIATFSVAEPVSFAVVNTTSSGSNGNDDGGFVPTGETTCAFATAAIMLISATAIVFLRKRKINK